MSRKLQPDQLPGWPAALRAELAAAYLSLCVQKFHQLGLPAVDLKGVTVWTRADLDDYLDSRRPTRHTSPSVATVLARFDADAT